MSWITKVTDIAGKAEGFLNQLDQSAAVALQDSPGNRQKKSPSSYVANPAAQSYYTTSQLAATASESSYSLPPLRKEEHKASSGYGSSLSSSVSKPPKESSKPAMEDDSKLMEYLNESVEPSDSASSIGRGRHSRKSSSSSMRSLPAQLFKAAEQLMAPDADDKKEDTAESQAPATTYSFSTRVEREVVELKARETDLLKALQAKDSQLAVLRVRLQEADMQSKQTSVKLDSLLKEKERLLQDSADSSEVRNQALDSVQARLIETESALEMQRESSKRAEVEYMSRIQKLETEMENLSCELTAVQKCLVEEKLKKKENDDQLRLAKYNLEANKHEFDEYKQKAQRILQSKERLISTLKEGAGLTEVDQAGLAVQVEEIRSERDILKDDLQQSHMQVFNLKAEMQELESQLAGEQRNSLEQQRSMQDQCQTFQQSAAQYREQYEQLKQEYQYMQDELRRQQLSLQSKLQEKDAEIARLMSQSASRTVNGRSSPELEQRVKHLTENLIQKQTLIEALQTEKSALALQMERLERMYREAESAAVRTSATVINVATEETSNVSNRVPHFMRESPFDSGMAKGVKRAYGTLDTLSIKVGVFLRRYPMARVIIFLYIVLLHCWVMVVLLTYTPEIHPPGYGEPSGPAAAAKLPNK